jgi:hypothetical protein
MDGPEDKQQIARLESQLKELDRRCEALEHLNTDMHRLILVERARSSKLSRLRHQIVADSLTCSIQ